MTVQELYTRIGGSYESAKRTMAMDKLISRFVLKFLNDQSFQRLSDSWEARDPKGVFEGAHAMKGVCANLGMDSLSAAASEIAEEFRPGHDRKLEDQEITERVEALRKAYDVTIEGIQAFAAEQ